MKTILTTFFLIVILNGIQAQVTFVSNGQQFNNMKSRCVKIGDLNNDGNPDAFVVNEDNCRVYFGSESGQFTESTQRIPLTPWVWGADIGDINNDGKIDAIIDRTVWLNDGEGNFAAKPGQIGDSVSITIGLIVKLADLNGDGHLDIFSIRDFANIRVFINDGTGSFKFNGQNLGDGTIGTGQIAHIALGDINNDGFVDAVTGGWKWDGSTQCPNRIWLNDGKGNFQDSGQFLDEGVSHVHGLALGDLNSDGWIDLAMGIQDNSRSGRIYYNDGKGILIKGQILGGQSGENLAFGDFDGNGKLDIFSAISSQANRVWLNNGDSTFINNNQRPGTSTAMNWDVAISDVNSDKKPDAIIASVREGIQIWLNNSTVSLIEKKNDTGVLFYPNPTTGQFTLSFGTTTLIQATAEIYNTDGRLVLSKTFRNTATATIDLTGYPKGIYMVKTIADGMVYYEKFIIE